MNKTPIFPESPKQTQWNLKESFNSGVRSPKGKKVAAAITRLAQTGKLDPILIQGFNQNGKWTFIDKLEGITADDLKDPKEYTAIANYKLPLEQTVRTDKDGNVHLLTNYIHLEEKETLKLPYKSIAGFLSIKNALYIEAPNLESVGGKLSLERARSLKAPNLKLVNGDLKTRMAEVVELDSLEEIKGELDIYYARKAELSKLREVESVKIAHVPIPNIKKILKHICLKSLKSIRESLESRNSWLSGTGTGTGASSTPKPPKTPSVKSSTHSSFSLLEEKEIIQFLVSQIKTKTLLEELRSTKNTLEM
jgi:hypothetical protein